MAIDKSLVKRLVTQCGADEVGAPDRCVTVTLSGHYVFAPDDLQSFANAIAAHQREQSASVFTGEPSKMWMDRDVAEAILKGGWK